MGLSHLLTSRSPGPPADRQPLPPRAFDRVLEPATARIIGRVRVLFSACDVEMFGERSNRRVTEQIGNGNGDPQTSFNPAVDFREEQRMAAKIEKVLVRPHAWK